MSRAIDAYLAERIEAGEIPGAAWAIVDTKGIVDEGAAGLAVAVPVAVPATTDTIYDLASLTKPLVTSLLYLLLRRELDLPPSSPLRRHLPELDRLDKRDITLRHVLTHTAGFPEWVPFYLKGRTMAEYLAQLRDRPPEHRPGTRVLYSCAGYIVMGEVVARAAGEPLDRLFAQLVAAPLGLTSTSFRPPPAWRDRVAATEDSCEYERILSRRVAGESAGGYAGFRRGVVRGEVHDQNAWVLGGVAGNAGLFSTAREVGSIAREFLGAGAGLLDGGSLDLSRRDETPDLEEARSFAFRLALRGETAAGPDLPRASFGHNGFTGTSVWIDPLAARAYVLLTNRVHPAVSEALDMIRLRQRFHSAAGAE